MYLGPLTFDEIFKAKPWGGRALARVANKKLPPGDPIGESWEVADHPHGTSVVRSGPVQGKTLRDLISKHADALLGRSDGTDRFPLLIKTLDAGKRVSVQVHPDDRLARKMGLHDPGKTEAWYVLHARADGAAVVGFKSAGDIPRIRALLRSGTLGDRLRIVPQHEGEAWLCRAGAVHAYGPGIVVLEVQQNSDATFRLYDWDLVGLDGTPRALHVEEAIRAIGDKARRVVRANPRTLRSMPFPACRLLRCEHFVMDRWRVRRRIRRRKPAEFEVLYVVEGHGSITDGIWPSLRIGKGRTVLAPACVEAYDIDPVRPMTLLRIAEPK